MKVSVITPSFNQAEFLERTLLSVFNQEDVDFEYIVVDGQSTDGSVDILESYRDKIHHLTIEPDTGQADALRKGFKHATGDVLCYLNSDDVLLSGSLKQVVSYFQANPEVEAIYSNRVFVDESDRITKFWILPPHSDYCMSRWDFIPQETCFWRRSLMEKSGPIEPTYGFALDYDLFVRMMQQGRFKRVRKFLAAFRVHPMAKSSTLYETAGRQEIARVQSENGIAIHWYDTLLKYLFGGTILGTSIAFTVIAINVIRKQLRFPWQ